jgi:hypothetical protein
MPMKNVFVSILKYLLLVVIFFIVDMLKSIIVPIHFDWTPPPDQMPMVFGGLLLSALVIALVVSLIILRSNWSGWKLIGATFIAWYGCMTIMSQIETAWFGPAMGLPSDLAYKVALQGLVSVLILTPISVWIWGKAKAQVSAAEAQGRLPNTASGWVWKLSTIAVIYLVLYFGFGYVVAWQNPALRNMYGGGTNPIVFNPLYLIPLQIVRSALWVLFALPVIRMTRGSIWQVAIIVGLLYALPMNIGLFIPNPVMPDATVRLSHFIETATSNFIFGLAVTWLLSWRNSRQTLASASSVKA